MIKVLASDGMEKTAVATLREKGYEVTGAEPGLKLSRPWGRLIFWSPASVRAAR